MARCRCTSGQCDCHLVAGDNVIVTGNGSEIAPWVISSATAIDTIQFRDNNEIDFAVTGDGTTAVPYEVSATLPWVDPAAGTVGQVLAKQVDGSWAPAPPTSAPVGAIFVGPGLTGDGSAGDPIRICLATYDELKAAVDC